MSGQQPSEQAAPDVPDGTPAPDGPGAAQGVSRPSAGSRRFLPVPALSGRQKRVLATKSALFVNPRLLNFNKPFTLALMVLVLSVLGFGLYSHYLLGQCSKQSFTATTRSEMQQWLEEEDPYDPMNNYKANWDCLYYTAKLMDSDGDLLPDAAIASGFMNDYADNCAATGKCEHRYTYKATPGNVRYNKCDIGTVRYTKESKRAFYEWQIDSWRRIAAADPSNYSDYARFSEARRADQASFAGKLKAMLTQEDGAVPENVHGYSDVVWIGAHDVHQVPGAFDEVMLAIERVNADSSAGGGDEEGEAVSKDHPVWLYLQSRPYTRFDGAVVGSENMHKFEERGGMRTPLTDSEVAVLLQSPDIRLRGKGGGQFPGVCGSYHDSGPSTQKIWYGTDRRRSSVGRPGEERCHYGPDWGFNLSHSVLGFEFKLKTRETVQTAWDDQRLLNLLAREHRVQHIKDSRLLKRNMFCNPADYDEFILYQAQPGEEQCVEGKADEPECTLVRKCDLTGMMSATRPGFTSAAMQSEPAAQPEYGSFLVVYQACPKLIGTMGVSLGFIGQIEMLITFLTMACCLGCGCVGVRGEDTTGGIFDRVVRNVRLTLETAGEIEAVKDAPSPTAPGAHGRTRQAAGRE